MIEKNDLDGNHAKGFGYLIRCSKGNEKLWKAFWINFVLGNYLFSSLIYVNTDTTNKILVIFYLSLIVLYFLWSSLTVWRCASNSDSIFWAYMARVTVSAGTIFILYSELY
jgi:hypothetical protein